MRIGTAQLDITPPLGRPVIGQLLERRARTIYDPLYVNAVVLGEGDPRVALLSADACSMGNQTVAEVRQLAQEWCGISPERIFLCATHAHTGPALASALGTNCDEPIREMFVQWAASAIALAAEKTVEAELSWASGAAPGISFPRRWLMRDGTVKMNPAKDDSNKVRIMGEADPSVHAIFAKAGDRVAAVMVNFACHATVVDSDNAYCADYPGRVRRWLKQALGSETVVLFLNGACGDVTQYDRSNPKVWEYGIEWADRMGQVLAGEVMRIMPFASGSADPPLAVSRTMLDLPIREIPAADLKAAKDRFAGRDLDPPPTDVEDVYPRELLLLDQERRSDPLAHAELMGVRIGDAAIIGIPAEVFAAIGKQIKDSSPLKPTLVTELANGCVGYLPTADAFTGGGYETQLCRSSKLMPEVEEEVVKGAGEVLARLARD